MDPISPVTESSETINFVNPEEPKKVDEQKPYNSNGIVIAAVAIFVLLSLAIVGFLYYQNQQLKGMLASYQTPIGSPEPTAQAATPDPTAGWKTYTNKDLSFKYPTEWTLSGYVITSNIPKIKIIVTPKTSTLMNECMQLDTTQTVNNLSVKKFSRVTTGEMCETNDSNPREIWIAPSSKAYSPGINYEYSASESAQAELTFNQILSTFKFME